MNMKKIRVILLIGFMAFNSVVKAQTAPAADDIAKAKEWISSLDLNDSSKETRLVQIVAIHLTSVKEWHNSHPASTVPAE